MYSSLWQSVGAYQIRYQLDFPCTVMLPNLHTLPCTIVWLRAVAYRR